MKVALVYDDIFLQHRMPAFHPESVDRLKAILQAIGNRKDLEKSIEWIKPRKATREIFEFFNKCCGAIPEDQLIKK